MAGEFINQMTIIRDTGPVVDGIYLLDIGIWGIEKQMAVYVIVSSDQIALIDTGTKREIRTVVKELHQLGINKLDYILVTHSHIDHAGGIYKLIKQFSGTEICIPALALDLKKEYAIKSKKFNLSNPLRLLKEGDLIKLDSKYRLEVLETPGHIDDHISFLLKEMKILFVGDACGAHHLGKGFSRPSAYAPYFNHKKYIKTLNRFQKIAPSGLGIASYGFATDIDAQNCIKAAISDYNNWMETVIEYMKENKEESNVAEILLNKFGRSPGEIRENRPDQWVKTILTGIARGFIDSLGLRKE